MPINISKKPLITNQNHQTNAAAIAICALCMFATFFASTSIFVLFFLVVSLLTLGYSIEQKNPKITAIAGITLVLFIWLGWAKWGARFLYTHVLNADTKGTSPDAINLGALGQLGDLFGAINALFAAFAFIGVALAAFFQYRTTQMMENQFVQQSFEPLFFKLLDRATSPSILTAGDTKVSKAAACEELLEKIESERPPKENSPDSEDFRTHTRETCLCFYKTYESDLGAFFRKLYHTFKFIHKSNLTYEQKILYSNIARSALDKDDLILIAANTQVPEGKNFIPLIEYYGILKHIAENEPARELTMPQVQREAFLAEPQRKNHWKRNPNSLKIIESRLARL